MIEHLLNEIDGSLTAIVIVLVIMCFTSCYNTKDNTRAIREQTEVLKHFNLIQAPEHVEYFEQEKEK